MKKKLFEQTGKNSFKLLKESMKIETTITHNDQDIDVTVEFGTYEGVIEIYSVKDDSGKEYVKDISDETNDQLVADIEEYLKGKAEL